MFTVKIKIDVDILVDEEDFEKISKHKWYLAGSGYAATSEIGKVTFMHRWLMGSPKGMWIDHINGNKFDNRKENLRIATPSQSRMNSAKQTPKNRELTSKFKGIRKRKDSKEENRNWTAGIKHDGKRYHLGSFYTEEEAAKAYTEKAKELFGEFARLNFKN